jgi:hypothetical protein
MWTLVKNIAILWIQNKRHQTDPVVKVFIPYAYEMILGHCTYDREYKMMEYPIPSKITGVWRD